MPSHTVEADPFPASGPRHRSGLSAAHVAVALALGDEFMARFPLPHEFWIDFTTRDVGEGQRVLVGTASTDVELST
jgi:hypothetical protein